MSYKYKKPKNHEQYFLGSLLNKGINAIAPESEFANVAGSVLGTAVDAFTGNPMGAIKNGMDSVTDIASLFMANGGELTEFTEGGSHEMNPNGGIPLGQNLVEQGETMHRDFIYSDRLKVTKELAKEYNLPNKAIGKSFADVSKMYNDESRPNDAIANKGKERELANLRQAQESYKRVEGIETGVMMATGGWPPDTLGKQSWPNPLAYTYPRTGYDYPEVDFSYENPLLNSEQNLQTPQTSQGIGQPGLQKYSQQPDSGTRATSTPSGGTTTGRPKEEIMNLPSKGIPVYTLTEDPAIGINDNNNINSPNLALRKTSNVPAPTGSPATTGGSGDRGLSLTDLRYAPIAGDIISGAMLLGNKPELTPENQYDITTRAKADLVDRQGIINSINSGAGATEQSLINNSTNSGNLQANLLGASRVRNKAIGDAMLQSDIADQAEINDAEAKNIRIDAINRQNRMQVKNMNDADEGAYRTALMDTITNAFQNIGGVGTEEVYRNIAEGLPIQYFMDRQFRNTYKKQGQ